MWLRFWHWCSEREGWKSLAGLTYLLICVFDFIVVPSWIGVTRQEILSDLEMAKLVALDVSIQMELVRGMSYQHEPFTLKGGGLFHLAFGALLTGSAIAGRKNTNDTNLR
jgi:hypothetical protein